MIATDTNILVRYFAEDDALQTACARRFLEDDARRFEPAFISLVTLVELLWVLTDSYGIAKAMQREVVARLLDAPNILIEKADIVVLAIDLDHGDIADRIIHLVGKHNGCARTMTFDPKFARLEGVALLA